VPFNFLKNGGRKKKGKKGWKRGGGETLVWVHVPHSLLSKKGKRKRKKRFTFLIGLDLAHKKRGEKEGIESRKKLIRAPRMH